MKKILASVAAFSLAASIALAGEHPIGEPVEANGMEIAAVYLQPIDMEPKGIDLAPSQADIHLEADIHAIAGNKNGFGEGEWVPTHCVTQGLGTIMEARHIVMVATGQHKADAVAAMIEGPVAAVCPASILQFHPSVLVVVDEAAATGLNHADYFRHVVDILI